MEDQYGMVDLRQYITGRPLFRPIPQTPQPDILASHCFLNPLNNNNPYGGMLMFRSDSNNSVTTANAAASGGAATAFSSGGGSRFIAFESGVNGCSSPSLSGRWPRQETLTLLEIRSKLDTKFREANQKGPLWDEISRIMSEEHGYQRSGKKCREKFENLYKYYKKTKEGKAGRQDGKHYRFFRQLEAIYGEPYNYSASVSASGHINPLDASVHCDMPNKNSSSINRESFQGSKLLDNSISLSNSSDAETSSSSGDDSNLNEGREGKNSSKGKKIRGWKVKVGDFIDAQMKRLMDKQEAWMERMMGAIEEREQERMQREEEWRKEDSARIERERELWAAERAWIGARDAALMEALHKLTDGNDGLRALPREDIIMAEIHSLRDQTTMCKESWDSTVNINYLHKKTSKENLYSQILEAIPNQEEQGFDHTVRVNDGSRDSTAMNDHCFRHLMGDACARILD